MFAVGTRTYALVKGAIMTLRFRDELPEDQDPPAPAPTKPVFQVPPSKNENFTGRDGLIEDLRADLTAAETPKHIQALYGLGGVGKTQIAVEYAYRFRDKYRIVYWLRAEDTAAT